MAPPHMTGRSSSASTGETRTAADLLDDDGTVDHSAIASISNSNADRDGRVDVAEASEIRRRLLQGESQADIGDDLGRGMMTIWEHAHGNIDPVGNETPEVPPVEYVDGEWQVVDDE